VADGVRVDPATTHRLGPVPAMLQIDFTALSFRSPAKLRFRYQLEGFDAQWVEAGTRRQAFYTNLPARDYRFRISAGHDGVWTESAPWGFSVSPRFYETSWFYGGCLLLVGIAAAFAWRMHVHQVRHELSLVLAERTRMAREIHDTLLQSLVAVAFNLD